MIFLTLKNSKTGDEKRAFSALRNEIAREFDRHSDVLKSDLLGEEDAASFKRFRDKKAEPGEYVESI